VRHVPALLCALALGCTTPMTMSGDSGLDSATSMDAGPNHDGGNDAASNVDSGVQVDAASDHDAAGGGSCTPGTVCRAAVDACDVAESCDTTGHCPADAFASAATTCLAAGCTDGVAQPAQHCDGATDTCVTQATIPCNGFACSGATCGTTCTSDANCLSTHWCQPGGLCAPKRIDGQPCASATECMSGACTASFVDADHDGQGTGASATFCGASPPTGRAASAGDCCDTEARAFVGQTAFFGTASACGGFDFNCNGSATQQDPIGNACQSSGGCGTGDRDCPGAPDEVGWVLGTPACGVSASYVTACGRMTACAPATCPGCGVCRQTTATRTQACN